MQGQRRKLHMANIASDEWNFFFCTRFHNLPNWNWKKKKTPKNQRVIIFQLPNWTPPQQRPAATRKRLSLRVQNKPTLSLYRMDFFLAEGRVADDTPFWKFYFENISTRAVALRPWEAPTTREAGKRSV